MFFKVKKGNNNNKLDKGLTSSSISRTISIGVFFEKNIGTLVQSA